MRSQNLHFNKIPGACFTIYEGRAGAAQEGALCAVLVQGQDCWEDAVHLAVGGLLRGTLQLLLSHLSDFHPPDLGAP